MTNSNYTKDDFLGGRIKIKQPKKGYRITSDTVFLAASIKLNKGDYILDVGAGNGGILSCIAARIGNDTKNVKMHGIEVQPDLILLAKDNNKEVTYFQGDLFKDIEGCAPNSYHNVVTNPPYFEKGKVTPSPFNTKAIAHGNELNDLKVWIERCMRMVRPKGYLTLVHRADRMDDILSAIQGKAGSIIVYPFYSKDGVDANRVIIRAQKGAKGLLTLKSGMIVHKSDGNYTEAADSVLRHANFLDIEK